ncbi:hypothetical protein [Lonepinella sp. BR2357]|uniref:hypothetical protein n=1 Tax=Lonepinella sp. BR2357 TaxID=3434549 RepID=UPI003F6DBF51
MNKINDFIDIVEKFMVEGQKGDHRYRTFDFCYAYFHPINKSKREMTTACYVLWSYLASWGMLRNSFLLNKNPAYLINLIQFIFDQDEALWEIQIEPQNYAKIAQLYDNVAAQFKNQSPTITLITKILLGVFGIMPAYDRYFRATFSEISAQYGGKYHSFHQFQPTFDVLFHFIQAHQGEIRQLQDHLNIIDFYGNATELHYPIAKIIDMYGFNQSFFIHQPTLTNLEEMTMVKKNATLNQYLIEQEDSGKINVLSQYEDGTVKASLREIAEAIGFEFDSAWTTQQFGRRLADFVENANEIIAKEAVYRVQILENNKVNTFKYKTDYSTKEALRELAKLVDGFAVDEKWNTQQLGSKLIDVING